MSSTYTDSQQRRYIGTSSRRSKSGGVDIKSLLNITRTNNDYSLCVRTGVFAFFGLGDLLNGDGDSRGSSFTTLLLNSVTAPEHPVVQARAFLRSFLVIADSMKSVVTAFQSNPLAGSKQILNFANVVVHSKFLGALNTFAVLGDAVLSFSTDDIDEAASDGGFGRKISRMDNDDNTDAHSKNRLKNSTRLAWSSYRSPDMLLQSTLRPYALKANFLPDNSDGLKYIALKDNEKMSSGYCNPKNDDNRISGEIREAVEASLDSEYLPFYFHDLRTNEILSFHAFLSTIGESYAVAYETSEGFGRVDPVKIYKNTRRKIDFSFYVVATSTEDFDSMWTKINKLTTLLYPQYTPGKKVDTVLDNVEYKFYAPFSQQMSASPMIRLRIGDLIANNYSRFNLARMFGYGTADTKFSISKNELEIVKAKNAAAEGWKRRAIHTPQEGWIYAADTSFFTSYKGNSGSHFPDPAVTRAIEFANAGGRFKLTKAPKVSSVNEAMSLNLDFEPVIDSNLDRHEEGLAGAAQTVDVMNEKFYKLKNILSGIPNNTVSIPFKMMRLTPQGMKIVDIQAQQKSNDMNPQERKIIVAAADTRDGMNNFMNEDTNAVSKSFKTVGGKGVAGFIDSLSFDWHDKVTWAGVGDSPGISRAPKMCKITISYSPIHDISPGLDHKGLNRAPIYPIGPMSRKDI